VKILIRFDDIAENMNWHLMEKCEKLFDKYKIKPILGVIPNNQDPELKRYPKNENFWHKIKIWQSKGWEISMHGYNHVYKTDTNKKDYFKYGGKSEFFGVPLENQIIKIQKGLDIFKNNGVDIRCFFAPNHTYDANTFEALKKLGVYQVIDGYGLKPYIEKGIKFIPQLFYKPILLPFGLQTTQLHLNYMDEKEFSKLQNLIEKNHKKIISYDEALDLLTDNLFNKLINKLIYFFLILKRKII
tara:strand:+ start:401 stop:1129 length:729 start_codon:yes stop_codon:yes gene_type:complete